MSGWQFRHYGRSIATAGDTLVLVAGDGDFYPLAEDLVERRGVRLIVLD